MCNDDPFSLSTMLDTLDDLLNADPVHVDTPAVPPPTYDYPDDLLHSFSDTTMTPQELETRFQWMFNIMTRIEQEEDLPFKQRISTLDSLELADMASLMTSDSDYFMDIARNQTGSKRLKKLLGKSADADAFFSDAISSRFCDFMTNKHACNVATRALRVLDEQRKEPLYEQLISYSLYLARNEHGCFALNEIIPELDNPWYKDLLLHSLGYDALSLSKDAHGHFVVQLVLQMDFQIVLFAMDSLRGHCVDLSYTKYGSLVVERLLRGAMESVVMVVLELLECDGEGLVKLARDEFGNLVVAKALVVTRLISKKNLFKALVDKLKPFLHLLRRSRGGTDIAYLLDSAHP